MSRIILTIDVPDVGQKRANINSSLYIGGLIDEIRNQHGLLEGSYALRRSTSKDLLDPGRTLEQLGIAEGETLVLLERTELKTDAQMMIEAGERVPISEENEVYLQSEREGHIYDIMWQPAVIGRADHNDPSKNRLLALDLSGLRGGEYVSRQHACIIERGDQYSVESLTPRNPTYLNDEELEYATSYVLQPGDRLRVGRITLIFHQRG